MIYRYQFYLTMCIRTLPKQSLDTIISSVGLLAIEIQDNLYVYLITYFRDFPPIYKVLIHILDRRVKFVK